MGQSSFFHFKLLFCKIGGLSLFLSSLQKQQYKITKVGQMPPLSKSSQSECF